MKRKIALFSLFAILTFALITTNVFAIFQLNRNVDVDATFGKVISCSVALEELTNRDDLGPDVAANYQAITSDRLGYDGSSLYCYASARRSFNTEEYLELKNLKVTVTADSTIFTLRDLQGKKIVKIIFLSTTSFTNGAIAFLDDSGNVALKLTNKNGTYGRGQVTGATIIDNVSFKSMRFESNGSTGNTYLLLEVATIS